MALATEGGGYEKVRLPYVISEAAVAIAAIIGNTLVIAAFKRDRKLRRCPSNHYIISLAVADLLVGLIGIPCAVLSSLGLPRHQFKLCLFSVSLLVVFCTISIFSLLAVSIDRYWAILHPMSYSARINTKITLGIICACWIMGTFIGFLPLLGWHGKRTEECVFTKVMDYSYLVFLFFGTIVFPAILLTIFYLHIYDVILKQVRQMVSLSESVNADRDNAGLSLNLLRETRRKEVNATENLSRIVLFFVLCWMPLYLINCLQAFWIGFDVPDIVMDLCIILSHLNSAGNPLLYAYHLSGFRWALKSLLITSLSGSSPYSNGYANNTVPAAGENVRHFKADGTSSSPSSMELKARQNLLLVARCDDGSKLSFGKKTNKLFAFGPKGTAEDGELDNSSSCCQFHTNPSFRPDYGYQSTTDADALNYFNLLNNDANNHRGPRISSNIELNSNASYGYISVDDTNYYESISSSTFNDLTTRDNNRRDNHNNYYRSKILS